MEQDTRSPPFGSLVQTWRGTPADETQAQPGTLSWLAPWVLAAAAVLLTVLVAG